MSRDSLRRRRHAQISQLDQPLVHPRRALSLQVRSVNRHLAALTVIKYSTALSGLLKLALKAFITCSLSNPMSTIPEMAIWSASPLMKLELLLLLSAPPALGVEGTGLAFGVGVEGVAGV